MATRTISKPPAAPTMPRPLDQTLRDALWGKLVGDMAEPLMEGPAIVWFLERVQSEFEGVLSLDNDDHQRIHWAVSALHDRLAQNFTTIAKCIDAAVALLKAPEPGGREGA